MDSELPGAEEQQQDPEDLGLPWDLPCTGTGKHVWL